MDELVEKLSAGRHPVMSTRPGTTAQELKVCIDRNFVHVLFQETGTELGFQLDKNGCLFQNCDFEKATGSVHLEGGLTLNYEKVKVVADIDLASLAGVGHLESIDETSYQRIVGKS
jgi:hypothetical protein